LAVNKFNKELIIRTPYDGSIITTTPEDEQLVTPSEIKMHVPNTKSGTKTKLLK